jgi:hypothetical protein
MQKGETEWIYCNITTPFADFCGLATIKDGGYGNKFVLSHLARAHPDALLYE